MGLSGMRKFIHIVGCAQTNESLTCTCHCLELLTSLTSPFVCRGRSHIMCTFLCLKPTAPLYCRLCTNRIVIRFELPPSEAYESIQFVGRMQKKIYIKVWKCFCLKHMSPIILLAVCKCIEYQVSKRLCVKVMIPAISLTVYKQASVCLCLKLMTSPTLSFVCKETVANHASVSFSSQRLPS